MDKSLLLKQAVLNKYKSVRAFAIDMNIPYSTLATAMDRGIDGMAYGTVIRMCERLGLNPLDFTPLDGNVTVSEKLLENKVMTYYMRLNETGREKVLDNMKDFLEISRYVD